MNIEGMLQYMVCEQAQQTSCCWQKCWIHIWRSRKPHRAVSAMQRF